VRYNLEQCVFPYDTYVKYVPATKCRRKFRRKFRDERVPSTQTIHNLVNKLRSTGLFNTQETKTEAPSAEEKSDDIGVSLNIRLKSH
jgi:hypothetical protein